MRHTKWQWGFRWSLTVALLCVTPLLTISALAGDSRNLPEIITSPIINDALETVSTSDSTDRVISEDQFDPIHPWDNNEFSDTNGTNGMRPRRNNIRDLQIQNSSKATQPEDIGGLSNFPNPFNAQTNIRFTLSVSTDVELRIYNLIGQRVRDVKLSSLSAGAHNWTWDGRVGDGQSAPSGIYFYRIISGSSSALGKMVLLK